LKAYLYLDNENEGHGQFRIFFAYIPLFMVKKGAN